jgi:alpha-glucosidase
VLQGEIGEYVSVARRTGQEWFVGTITNEDARTLRLPLDFLSAGVAYRAFIYEDGDLGDETRTHVARREVDVSAGDALDAILPAHGGQGVRFMPRA